MSRSGLPELLVSGARDSTGTPLTPASPSSDYPGPASKNRRTLKQLWHEADKKFFAETGYHLETAAPLHKDGVLQKWQGRYSGEKSSMQDKMDKLSPILQNIVNGVEIVGGIAAATASAVFGPAQMCFNAITFVLDAPGKIKHVYDCLEALFKEVANFLVKFKVLDRIDQAGRLDDELLENANKLLISFTHICAIAAKLLKKKRFVLQALETVFLTSDGGVRDALMEFEKLANSQAQTVGIISLEHILENEHLSQKILSEQYKVTAHFQAVLSKENDEKTRMVNKQKIAEIENKLFSKSELDQLSQLDQTEQIIDPLPETLDILMASKEYISWSAMEKTGTSELYLSGANHTGKSHFIDALREHLNQKRQNMLKHGPSLYVAYHSFADRRTTATSNNAVAQALKNLALQVANQSTRYTAELSEQLRDQKLTSENDSKKVWSILKLCDFGPPPDSVMYLLIDGLQGEDGFKSMQALRRLFADANTMDSEGGKFKVCILLAGVPEALRISSLQRPMVVEMVDLNGKLLGTFIDRELQMQGILTELDEKIRAQRAKFAKALLEQSKGNFLAARQKIKRMRSALDDDDATSLELEAIIEEDIQQTFDQQARETLNTLANGLSPRHLAQLEKILMWMLYGMPSTYWWWPVATLQAVLRIEQKDQTLESLPKKINTRFHSVLNISYGFVSLDDGVELYLRQMKDADSIELKEDARLISMTINIKNATKNELQHFILDLNARLASDTSIFSNNLSSSQECRIQISEAKALTEVARLSLTALNEGVPDDATKALAYAFIWLPRHFTELLRMKDKIPSADSKQLEAGLVAFLAEPYYLEHGPDLEILDGWEEAWFGETKDAGSFSRWLDECLQDLTSHRHLQARQRRWIKSAAVRNDGRPDYIREVALAIAGRWRTACLEGKNAYIRLCFEWLGGYITFLTAGDVKCDKETVEPAVVNGEVNSSHEQVEENRPASDVDRHSENELDDNIATAESQPAVDGGTVTAAVARLYSVADWTIGNLSSVQADAAHSYCIAVSLSELEAHNEARKHFEKARIDDQIGWRALIGMAHSTVAQGQPKEAATMFRQAISLARARHQEGKLVEHESNLFIDTLGILADIFATKLKQNDDAIRCLREILEHSPKDGQCRWFLFTELCKQEHYGEASELLDAWDQHPEQCGDQSPSGALCEMATRNDEMVSLVHATRQQTLRDRVLRILQQAISDAGDRSQQLEKTRMLYVLATAEASSPSAENHSGPLRYLEDILEQSQIQVSDPDQLEEIFRKAQRFASRMKFDDMRRQLNGQGPAHVYSLDTLRDDFSRYITRLGTASTDYSDSYWHVAGLCTILNQPEWCRSLLKPDVSDGVQILSDEDPENDHWGAENLFRAFSCCGSDMNARIAYSLLDRTARKKKLLVVSKPEDSSLDSENVPYEGCLRGCNICAEMLESIEGFWICRWCPDVDFCQSCFEDFRDGEKYHEHCSPDHEFVHFYHPGCEAEELEAGKVMIDWEIQYQENGDFSRKGGRLVDLEEWLARLRVEWDLPAHSTDTRAQA